MSKSEPIEKMEGKSLEYIIDIVMNCPPFTLIYSLAVESLAFRALEAAKTLKEVQAGLMELAEAAKKLG